MRTLPHDELIVLTSTKADGNFSFTYGESQQVIKDRQKFLTSHRCSLQNCVVMKTLNHDVIQVVTEKEQGRGTHGYDDVVMADALITTEPNILLFLLTADCLPLVLYDPEQRVLALAHLSRESAKKHLARKVVQYMSKTFHSNPSEVLAFLGPAIQSESYILERHQTELSEEWLPFIKEVSDENIAVDIPGFITHELEAAGIQVAHISHSAIDTFSSSEYFSHYRCVHTGDQEGRFATIVGMRNTQSNN